MHMASHIGHASKMDTVMEGWFGESEMLLHKTWPRSLSSKLSFQEERLQTEARRGELIECSEKNKQTGEGGGVCRKEPRQQLEIQEVSKKVVIEVFSTLSKRMPRCIQKEFITALFVIKTNACMHE